MFKTRIFIAVLLLTAAVVLLTVNTVLAEGQEVNFSGSFEVSGTSQTLNDDYAFAGLLPPLPINTFGDATGFRGDLGFSPSDRIGVKLRVSYLNNTVQSSPANGNFILSRGYLDLTPNNILSLRLGKQRLAWGTGYAWNPTNILDQKRNAFTSSDDPEGVVAFRADLNLGIMNGQLFLTPGNDWDTTGQAFRLKTSPIGMDVTLGWVKPGAAPTALTGDFAYSIAGIGLHGEVLYQKEGNRRSDKTDVLNYLVGAEYNLPGGFYLALEYYHNDAAYKDFNECLNEQVVYLITHSGDAATTAAAVATVLQSITDQSSNGGITRDHAFLRCAKTFGQDLNTEVLLVYNPNDKSFVSQPKLSYTLGQNAELYVKGLLISGQDEVEANFSPIKTQYNFGVKVSL